MYLLQDDAGQIQEAHSISAGLDYPGIGPEHSYLHENGRVKYTSVTDDQALAAVQMLARTEGILPALESAHAIHFAGELAATMSKDEIVVICLSGRGDKDVVTVRDALGGGLND
jgi:tryptophan synthase beta chain